MRMIKLSALFLILISHSLIADDKLVFVVDVIRHGDRTPTRTLDVVPYVWQEGLGQLTATGMQQSYQLGSKLRKRYIDEHGLLPNQYQPETLYIRSTDYDRTLMSAQSLLLGLYPLGTGPMLPHTNELALPSGFQPIPIHSQSREEDVLISTRISEDAYQTLLEKYVYSRPNWQKKNAALSPQFPRWRKLTGLAFERICIVLYKQVIFYLFTNNTMCHYL